MKKIAFLSILFILLAFIVSPVMAENPTGDRLTGSSKAAERKAIVQDRMEEKAAEHTASLQERADKEIARRIASLKKLITRISEFKKLSATQKTSLTTQVQTEIDKLTALKAKIAADTDPTTLKADVQSIVTSYRIYAVFMPKIQILGAADRILTVTDEMTVWATKLETKITALQATGEDVTDATALLTDMKAKIADAKTHAQSAIDTASAVTPEGYPDNKTQLQAARQLVETAIHDLNTARQDGRKITVWLIQKGGIVEKEKPATGSASKKPL